MTNSAAENQADTKKNIIIDLEASREAKSFSKEDDLIQRDALDLFKTRVEEIHQRIGEFKAKLDKKADGLNHFRTHDVILVDGPRGSGKTTFILSAAKVLEDSFKEKGIIFLGVIDPTLIETREHIFVTIIAKIKRHMENWFSQNSNDVEMRKQEQWYESLRELACGLSLLDGVGTAPEDDWQDEQFVLEQGLKHARHGGDLEVNFHKFLNESLKLLHQEAFMLAFDDIDTQFSIGWNVLEVIRKYLTTPQLMVVLSGDLQLYKTLVEKQQWAHLNMDLRTAETYRAPYQPQIDELVDQYLLKTLKPSNRIEIHALRRYVSDTYDGKVLIKGKHNKEEDIEDVLKNFCKKALYLDAQQEKERVVNLLLLHPARTIIELLRIMDQTREPASDDTSEKKPLALKDYPDTKGDLFLDLYNIFRGSLDKLGYRREDFIGFSPAASVERLVEVLWHARLEGGYLTYKSKKTESTSLLQQATALRPIFADSNLNDAMIVLGGFFARNLERHRAGYFHYMLKASMSAYLLHTRGVVDAPKSKNKTEATDFGNYSEQVGLFQLHDCRDFAGRHIAFLYYNHSFIGFQQIRSKQKVNWTDVKARYASENDPKASKFDSVDPFWKLVDHDSIENKERTLGVYINTPETLQKSITSWHSVLVGLLFSINLDSVGKRAHVLSIFSLLGSLGNLLESSKDSFENALIAAGEIKEYMTRGEIDIVEDGSDSSTDIEDYITQSQAQDKEIPDIFVSAFERWKNLNPCKNTKFPPMLVVDRMWSLFMSTLQKIQEVLPAEERLPGNLLHRWIVAFLHAAFVEEAFFMYGHKIGKRRIPVESPVRDQSAWIQTIYAIEDLTKQNPMENLSFFRWLWLCPLWAFFLDLKSDIGKGFVGVLERNKIISNTDEFEECMKVSFDFTTNKSVNLFHPLNSLVPFKMPPIKHFANINDTIGAVGDARNGNVSSKFTTEASRFFDLFNSERKMIYNNWKKSKLSKNFPETDVTYRKAYYKIIRPVIQKHHDKVEWIPKFLQPSSDKFRTTVIPALKKVLASFDD